VRLQLIPAMRILVIEDELQLSGHICRALSRRGHILRAESDGAAGLQAALADPPDLVVLDLGLPTIDGLEVLTRIRQASRSLRVLILTARGEVGHRIKGLTAGADDYMGKPFAMDELVARVEALGRRSATTEPQDMLKVGDLQMNVRERKVIRGGRPIPLSPREFEVLKVLMQEPGRTFSRTELCERVWQRDHQYETRTVEIFITRLRRKIETDFSVPLIHTVRTIGYAISETNPVGIRPRP
jgi:DNA-binding response OmpR family regulator